MKVIQPGQSNIVKHNKQGEVVFRVNRSLQKLYCSSQNKNQMVNPNKEISLPCLINSLHLYINEDKSIPKNYVKRVIQILNQCQAKSSLIDFYRNPTEKTSQRNSNVNQRQQTEDISQNATNLERNNQRKESSRIRKVKTRKLFQLNAADFKENEVQEGPISLQKRMNELQDKIMEYKSTAQQYQKELKEKQIMITTLQLQKQQKKTAIAQILRDRLKNESRLNSELNDLRQQIEQTKKKICQLKTQLVEREMEIVSFWSCALKQSK